MTLETILQRIGAYVDQDASTPTGTDFSVRTVYVNEAYEKWGNHYDWDEMIEPYEIDTTSSLVTVPLPARFKKLASPLYVYPTNGSNPIEYPEVSEDSRFSMNDTDSFCYISGNEESGQYLIVPKGIESGVSCVADIYRTPEALVSTGNIPVIPDVNYLVQMGMAQVWKSRGDARFQNAEASAENLMSAMMEEQQSKKIKSGRNKIPNYYEKIGFRIGRR